jgi:ribose transport system permease protein
MGEKLKQLPAKLKGMLPKNKKEAIEMLRKAIPIAGLVLLFLIFAVSTGGKFLKPNNLKTLITQSAITMVAAVGTAFVMAHNNLDFSLGGACALACVISYLLTNAMGGGLALFFILCIVLGILCGLFSAALHIKGEIPAFMAGLCLMFAGRGVAKGITSGRNMLMFEASKFNKFGFIVAVVIVVLVVGVIVFNYTKVGKYQKLIGTNPKATMLSGINVNKYKTIAFAISGATLGIAACLTVIRSPSITGSTGTNLETNVLLALCLGGMPMTGGSSSRIRSAVVGTLIFYILNNGLTLWGVNPNYVDIIRAIFFLATVAISTDRKQSGFVA